MGPCVNNHILLVRQLVIGIFPIRVDGKHQNFHPLQVIVIPKLQDLGTQFTQILCRQIHAWNFLFQRVDHLITRRLHPLAFHGSRTGSRNLPVSIKSPEMIDSQNIKHPAVVANSVHPELITVRLQPFPVIDRIPPPLPSRAEIVRWNTRDENRPAILIQKEVLFLAPDIHRVDSHVKGYIPHNLDFLIRGKLLNPHPLRVKEILQKYLILRLFFHSL